MRSFGGRVFAAFAFLIYSLAAFGQEADLGVSKSGPGTAAADTDVTFIIVLQNNGPDDASGTVMSDNLPAGLTFVSVNQPAGFTCTDPGAGNNGVVSCTNGTFTSGSTATFNLVVHVDPSTPPG